METIKRIYSFLKEFTSFIGFITIIFISYIVISNWSPISNNKENLKLTNSVEINEETPYYDISIAQSANDFINQAKYRIKAGGGEIYLVPNEIQYFEVSPFSRDSIITHSNHCSPPLVFKIDL